MQKNKHLAHLPYLALLVLITVVSHLQWFNLFSVISWGDWYYWPSSVVGHLIYIWGSWISFLDLGYQNIQINFLFFKSIWSILFNLGIGYDISSKLTFFIPIAVLSFISPYLLSYKITKSKTISFVSAVYYGTTTYGLFVQPPIQLVYSLAPLVIFIFLVSIEKEKFFNWLIFSIVFWIGLSYEPRIMLVTTFALFIIFILKFEPSIRKFLYILAILLIETGLNFFWILPTFLGGGLKSISAVTSRDLFGNNLFDIFHSLTLYNWLWTGGYPNKTFVQQQVMLYFWVFPFIAFMPFLFNFRSVKNKRLLLSFAIIAIFGIFLAKQSAPPFAQVYGLLYKYLPGFSLFREASKFYLLTAIGYSGLIAIGLQELIKRSKFLAICLSILILSTTLINLKPLITGEIGTLFVGREVPNDYVVLSRVITSDTSYFRTLWIPFYSRWSTFSEKHPEIAATNLINANWKGLIKSSNPEYSDQESFLDLTKKPFFGNLLSESSIKFVIIPMEDKANDDDFFAVYGISNKEIRNVLMNARNLKKINIGTKKTIVFEVLHYKPHLYLTQEKESIFKNINFQNISYSVVNTNQYNISLKSIKSPIYINFSENYNTGWKLRIGGFNWFSSLIDKQYFISDKYHFQNNATLNSFYVIPENLCSQFSCKKNSDGSYDINLTLYFAPQSWLYLGVFISSTTLILIFGFSLFVFVKHIYDKYY